MTQERPPPARPWYELVIREIALMGWTKVELSDRSRVARTTIDNWNTNSRRPSAKAVNAVADVLGIDRARAHILAGIVSGERTAEPDILPEGLREAVQAEVDAGRLTPEEGADVVAAVEATLRGEPVPVRRRAAIR